MAKHRQPAGQAGNGCRQYKSQQLVGINVEADEPGSQLVLADSGKHLAERRLRHAEQESGNQKSNDTHKGSEEHTSELQSLMRISYAVFCLKKKKTKHTNKKHITIMKITKT